jgi:WD40 repeat protein
MTAETLRAARLSSRPCLAAGIDAHGRVKAVAEDGRIRIFAGDAISKRYLPGFQGMARLDVSPGGEWIAMGNWRGNRTEVWDVRTGREVATLLPGTESVNVRFSPDGRWLATGSSHDYRLWRTGLWTEAMRFERPKRFSHLPGTMDFSGDAGLLALMMDQSAIRIVHVSSGAEIATLRLGDPQAVVELRFSSDARRLAAATSTNQILIWELDRIRRKLHTLGLDDGLDSAWPLPSGDILGPEAAAHRGPR